MAGRGRGRAGRDRVPERGRPAAAAGDAPAPRDRGPARPRHQPVAAGAAVAHREPGAGPARRIGRVRGADPEPGVAAAHDTAGHGVGAGDHRQSERPGGGGGGDARHRIGGGHQPALVPGARCPSGRPRPYPGRAGQAPAAAGRAARGPGRPLGDPARRRRAVPAEPPQRQHARHRARPRQRAGCTRRFHRHRPHPGRRGQVLRVGPRQGRDDPGRRAGERRAEHPLAKRPRRGVPAARVGRHAHHAEWHGALREPRDTGLLRDDGHAHPGGTRIPGGGAHAGSGDGRQRDPRAAGVAASFGGWRMRVPVRPGRVHDGRGGGGGRAPVPSRRGRPASVLLRAAAFGRHRAARDPRPDGARPISPGPRAAGRDRRAGRGRSLHSHRVAGRGAQSADPALAVGGVAVHRLRPARGPAGRHRPLVVGVLRRLAAAARVRGAPRGGGEPRRAGAAGPERRPPPGADRERRRAADRGRRDAPHRRPAPRRAPARPRRVRGRCGRPPRRRDPRQPVAGPARFARQSGGGASRRVSRIGP